MKTEQNIKQRSNNLKKNKQFPIKHLELKINEKKYFVINHNLQIQLFTTRHPTASRPIPSSKICTQNVMNFRNTVELLVDPPPSV